MCALQYLHAPRLLRIVQARDLRTLSESGEPVSGLRAGAAVIADVAVEHFDRYDNFSGCEPCRAPEKSGKAHLHATCKCDCHKRRDRRVRVTVSCGHSYDTGGRIDSEPPRVGDPGRCLQAGCWSRDVSSALETAELAPRREPVQIGMPDWS